MPVFSARGDRFSPGQAELVRALENVGRVTRQELAMVIGVRAGTVTRRIDPLIRYGYIQEEPGKWGDSLSRCAYMLTARGLMLASKLRCERVNHAK